MMTFIYNVVTLIFCVLAEQRIGVKVNLLMYNKFCLFLLLWLLIEYCTFTANTISYFFKKNASCQTQNYIASYIELYLQTYTCQNVIQNFRAASGIFQKGPFWRCFTQKYLNITLFMEKGHFFVKFYKGQQPTIGR